MENPFMVDSVLPVSFIFIMNSKISIATVSIKSVKAAEKLLNLNQQQNSISVN